jgi:hypothetical protein
MTNTVIWPDVPFENAMSPDHVSGPFSGSFHSHSAVIYCILDYVRPFVPCCLFLSFFLSFLSWSHLTTHCRCRRVTVASYHTQKHTTFGRTPLDEGSFRRRDLYPRIHYNPCSHRYSNPQPEQAKGRRPMPLTTWPPLIVFSQNCIVVVYRISKQKGIRKLSRLSMHVTIR